MTRAGRGAAALGLGLAGAVLIAGAVLSLARPAACAWCPSHACLGDSTCGRCTCVIVGDETKGRCQARADD